MSAPNRPILFRSVDLVVLLIALTGCVTPAADRSFEADPQHLGEYLGVSAPLANEQLARADALRAAFASVASSLGISVQYSENLLEVVHSTDSIAVPQLHRRAETHLGAEPVRIRDYKIVRSRVETRDGAWIARVLLVLSDADLRRLRAESQARRRVVEAAWNARVQRFGADCRGFEARVSNGDLVGAWSAIAGLVSAAESIRSSTDFVFFKHQLSSEVYRRLLMSPQEWVSESVSDMRFLLLSGSPIRLHHRGAPAQVAGAWYVGQARVAGLPTRIEAPWLLSRTVVADVDGVVGFKVSAADGASWLRVSVDVQPLGLQPDWFVSAPNITIPVETFGRVAVDAPDRVAGSYIEVHGIGTADAASGSDRALAQARALEAARVAALARAAEILRGETVSSRATVSTQKRFQVQVTAHSQATIRGAVEIARRIQWNGTVPVATLRLRVPVQ